MRPGVWVLCVLVLNLAGGRTQPLRQLSWGCQAVGREQLSPETGATERSSFQSPCIGFGNTLALLSDHYWIFFFLTSSGTLFLRTAAVASLKAEVSVPIPGVDVWTDGLQRRGFRRAVCLNKRFCS